MALLLGLAQPTAIHSDFVALFPVFQYRYTGGRYQDEVFRYRLFIPGTASTSGKSPLIVWLHGYGEHGSDNTYQLRWLDELIIRRADEPHRYPFYVLAVQCPDDNAGWHHRSGPGGVDGMVDVAAAIVREVLVNHPIDRDKVYLSGVSDGGTGCWRFAVEFPDFFAAVAPLGSAGAGRADLRRLVGISVWAFHSQDDRVTSRDAVARTVDALNKIGGNANLTLVNTDQHDCWTAAFGEYQLLDWLLAQRRGQPSIACGTISMRGHVQNLLKRWTWWQLLLEAAVVAALTFAACHALRLLRGKRV